MSTRAIAKLAWWLGPWTSDEGVPGDVEAEDVDVPAGAGHERPMRARIYRPAKRQAEGSLLLVQGLHYAGPDDPRMDRFARILASTGIVVHAPFLPDFAKLRVAESLVGDTMRAFAQLEALPGRPPTKPGVFSISFGSMPALRLAADPEHADRVGGLVCFGGYADFRETILFCLAGEEGLPHDPLNRPAVYINLIEHIDGVPDDPSALLAAWERFVHSTWGRVHMKEKRNYAPVAEEIAETLPEDQRELFLQGCDVIPGGEERGLEALARGASHFEYLDPRPHLSTIRCPVTVVHGTDDDVIPFTEAEKIREALPSGIRARVYLTGMYAHTGGTGLSSFLQKARVVPKELRSMVGILGAIRKVACGGEWGTGRGSGTGTGTGTGTGV
jgi:pimeloyl-ACP methyl ester carboxylesterase